MRVIAGEAKGRPLHAPRSSAVRPTSDKIKGALFSMLESLLYSRRSAGEAELGPSDVWDGLRWLDLYAGTGALAIEALSRGAAWADLVEGNPAACRVIRRNLAETGLAARAHLFCQTVQAALASDSVLLSRGGYDIIALDPPYDDPSVGSVLPLLSDSPLWRKGGLLAVEHSRRLPLAPEYGRLVLARDRTHGDTVLSVYVKQEATA